MVCTSGYVIDIIKDVMTSDEYTSKYFTGGGMNTYPSHVDNGEVMSGDRYIYHIEVTNEGPGDAHDVVVSDTLPV